MPDFKKLTRERLEDMAEAGARILECYRVLQKTGDNMVGEVLRGHGTFYERDHYPPGDAYDTATHSQHYYHAHRKGEHGHFHTFMRSAGMGAGVALVEQSRADYMDERDDTICHLIAISMNRAGYPISLFTTNRWVTAENWYAAADVIGMLDGFDMDMVPPSWPVNIWISAMVRLFRSDIEDLIHQRDRGLTKWLKAHPDSDAFEDRGLEVVSERRISVEKQITKISKALERA